MVQQLSIHSQDIANRVRRNGYVFLKQFCPGQPTIDIGRLVGTVVEMETLLPGSGIPTVQTLTPRRTYESSSNRYSGTYGLADFPLHTDLALWARPPRYLILRCQSGSKSVVTRMLPASALDSVLETGLVQRAVVRPGRIRGSRKLCPLPIVFQTEAGCGFRWDPLFLAPMNIPARRLYECVSANAWDQTRLLNFQLVNLGDTLIVDNWLMLHGRSSVPITDSARSLERIYLWELTR